MINFPNFRLWRVKTICVQGQSYKIVKYKHAVRIGAVVKSETYKKHYVGLRMDGNNILPGEPIVRRTSDGVIECILRIHSERCNELINRCRTALSADDPVALENCLPELMAMLKANE